MRDFYNKKLNDTSIPFYLLNNRYPDWLSLSAESIGWEEHFEKC